MPHTRSRSGISSSLAAALSVIALIIGLVVGAFAVGPITAPEKVVTRVVGETVVRTVTATAVSTATVEKLMTVTVTTTLTPTPPQPIKVRFASIAFPSYMMFLQLIIQAKRFDLKHGLDITWVPQSTIPGFYATITTGEADVIPGGGPLVFQRMYLEGVKLKITNTLVPMSAVIIATTKPDIRSVADLKGKKLAIDVGAAEFVVLKTYGKVVGIDVEKEITIVPSAYPVARSRLITGEVDAAVLVEPHISLARKENPNVRRVVSFEDLWREITGQPYAVYLVTAVREDFLKANPQLVERMIAMFQEVEDFIRRNPEEADRILAEGMKIERGIMLSGILSRDVQYMTIQIWREDAKSAVTTMFSKSVEVGALPKEPGPDILYSP
jgi:ABC-type nitrate/sulfonate/bicarbonate transport system substrate-binding protein